MLKTAAIVALIIFHLAIFTIAAPKVPRVIRAARLSRVIAALGALSLLALMMVPVARFVVHSRALFIAAAVVTMISFVLTFKLSTRVKM
jgi:hypothetical protein